MNRVRKIVSFVLLAFLSLSPLAAQSSTRRQPNTFPIMIRVNVPTAEITFNGGPLKGPFPKVIEMPLGTYSITAKAPGYQDYVSKVQVTPKGADVNIVLQAASNHAVTFTSNAAGATLTLNRQTYALPITITLAPGTYNISAGAPGFKPFSANLAVSGPLTFPITLEAHTYPLTLSVNLPQARVTLNKSDLRGKFPQVINVSPGTYEVTATAPGYRPYTGFIQIVDRAITFPIVLEPQTARIRAESVTIFLDGIQQPEGTFEVTPGKRRVRILLGKHLIGEKDMTFEADEIYDLELKFDFDIKKSK